METMYNLLQAIDPSKIKVPISERFSKLTLSSHKKQRQRQQELEEANKNGQDMVYNEKRTSASRNLLEQLSQKGSSQSAEQLPPRNPLLRSETSKDLSDEESVDNIQSNYFETMDPLNVTEDDSDNQHLDDLEHLAVDVLSQKISALTMVSRPISVSSSSACMDSLEEVTQLVSTESQRSSMGEIIRPFHNIEEVPVRVHKKEVITLSSSTSATNSHQNVENAYEMTDDEDEAITISDSSVSHGAGEDQGEMAMSTLNTVKDTRVTLQLPNLSPEKMQRVAAFLRDVSIEQKNLEENGRFSMEDLEYNLNLENVARARKMATAETESMTPEDEDESTPPSLLERQRRLMALDENSEKGPPIKKDDNVRRLAHDETQDNSILTDQPKETKTTKEDDVRRLANDDTQSNSILTNLQFSPSQSYEAENVDKTPQNNVRRILSAETQENTLQEDPEVNTANSANTSQGNESYQKKARRLVSTETEENTINTEMQLNDSQTSPTADDRRLALDETEDNTQLHLSSTNSLDDKSTVEDRVEDKDCRMVVCVDTETNSSLSAPSSPVTKRPIQNMAECETEINSPLSSPVMKTPRKNLQSSYGSVHSLISSSSAEHINDNSAPEHSITILETDDEQTECGKEHSPVSKSPQSNDNNKLSNSFQNAEEYEEIDDTDDDSDSDVEMSKIQMSMANINISAKINIKIHIPNSTETSEDDSSGHRRYTNSSSDRPQSGKNISRCKQTPSKYDTGKRRNTAMSPNISPNNEENKSKDNENVSISSSDKSTNNVEEDEKFVDEAQKLLNQLYGNSWQTPDVMRKLKRPTDSGEKSITANKSKDVLSTAGKRNQKNIPRKVDKNESTSKLVEESVLADFSIFRRNIVKTNLDSTRLVTLKTKSSQTSTKTNGLTEPRNGRKPRIEREKQVAAPQTEVVRKQRMRTPVVTKISTQQVRSQNDRWRKQLDDTSESEGNNASDDDDADKSNESDRSDSDFEDSSTKPLKGNVNKKVASTKKTITKYKNDPVDDDSNDDIQSSDVSWKCESDTEDDSEEDGGDADKISKTKGKSTRRKCGDRNKKKNANNSKDELVYLDLSKEEISILEDVPSSPPANHDVTFASRLNDILKTCRHEDKPKLPSSAQEVKSKRKLFTPMHNLEEDVIVVPEVVEKKNRELLMDENESIILDNLNSPFDSLGRPKKLDIINKQLTSVAQGNLIFPLTPSPKKPKTPLNIVNKQLESVKGGKPISSPKKPPPPKTPSNVRKAKENNKTPSSKTKDNSPTTARKGTPTKLEELIRTPNYKYSFLKSLDVTVSKAFCHPDALHYRDNYRTKKEDLSIILYEMYNQKLFRNNLNVPITWNKKLLNTAGRCLNKKKLGVRSSVIELSDKVLTSADRLRCTLIHELCHAATWIFNGEGGHGRTWKSWANQANATFPEIPKIGVCHQYDIEYKYTYKCTLCGAKSHAHSKSKKVENIRCSYCHGAIEIFHNKKDKDGNILPTPVREATGFAKFVKDNYNKFKREDLKHADVMKVLSNEFASLKLTKNLK